MAASRKVLVAVGQMTSGRSRQANLDVCRQLAQKAAAAGAKLLCLPECFHFMGSSSTESLAIAEPLDGEWMRRYKEMARDNNIMLSLGGFQESGPDASHLRNTHVLVSSEGAITATYSKAHLFDLDLPTVKLMESSFTTAGTEMVVADTVAGRLGLSVCYDVRFPSLYQAMARAGAQVLLVPAAFTVPTGMAHWEVLLRARAIENQCYVIAAAQQGKHNEKRTSYGRSMVIDPWGTIVAQCTQGSEPNIALAELDLQHLASVRERMPVAHHARPALYAKPVQVIPQAGGGVAGSGAGSGAGASADSSSAAGAGSGAGAGAGAGGGVSAASSGAEAPRQSTATQPGAQVGVHASIPTRVEVGARVSHGPWDLVSARRMSSSAAAAAGAAAAPSVTSGFVLSPSSNPAVGASSQAATAAAAAAAAAAAMSAVPPVAGMAQSPSPAQVPRRSILKRFSTVPALRDLARSVPHRHIPVRVKVQRQCALCSYKGANGRQLGYKTTMECAICHVPLCNPTKRWLDRRGQQETCFDMWHRQMRLPGYRVIPPRDSTEAKKRTRATNPNAEDRLARHRSSKRLRIASSTPSPPPPPQPTNLATTRLAIAQAGEA